MKTRSMILSILAASLLVGCTAPAADPKNSQQSAMPPSETSSSVPPAVAVNLSQEQSASLFDFSWSLFKQLHDQDKDSLVSSLSAFFALGMAANGANGQTLAQIEDALGVPVDVMNALSKSAIASAQGENRQLEIANSVWVKDLALSNDFQSILKNDYAGEGFETKFDADAVKQINNWVSEKTDGQIQDVVNEEELEDLMLLLINALNFDANWAEPYEKEAISSFVFADAKGNKAETECLMSQEEKYVDAGSLQGFIRPYENGRYAFAALIPTDEKQSLDDALEAVDPAKLEEVLQCPDFREVHATIPSFTLDSSMTLNNALKTIGITDAFEDTADFSKMTDDAALKLSFVKQKTKITVDAKGTKAAASTTVGAVPTSAPEDPEPPVTITCDRPFLFMILDGESGTPVFIGTLEELPESPSRS